MPHHLWRSQRMRMVPRTQIMQLIWQRRRALGIPSPLQHNRHLSQPRMLLPHLVMSLHRHMIDDRTSFSIFSFYIQFLHFSFSLVYLLIQHTLQFLKQFTVIYAVAWFGFKILVFVNDFEIDQLHDLSEQRCQITCFE